MASYWMKRLSAMILSIWHIVLVLTCMRTCYVLFLWDIKQYISYRSEILATLLTYAELALSAGKMMSYFFTHMFRYLQILGPQLCWILFYIMFSSFWVNTCKVHMLNGLYILSLIYQLGHAHGVLHGHHSSNIPYSIWQYHCNTDHIINVLAPFQNWGFSFVLSQTYVTLTKFIWKMLNIYNTK